MQALVIRHIFAYGFSFLVSFYLVPLMILAAHRLQFLDHPDGTIKRHERSVPYFGGVAVYIAFVGTLGLVLPYANHLLWFLGGITMLLFVGLTDDLIVLRPHQKIVGQCIAVLSFLKGGLAMHPLFFSHYSLLAITAFWMLSVINALNLVDVMDGLSSVLGLVAVLSFGVIGVVTGHYQVSLLMLSFAGALCAFLWYNKPPARIYLGDAGALLIGGFLAASPLLLPWSFFRMRGFMAPALILAVPLLILAIPLLETMCLVVIRMYKGIPFYQGSPHHFALYLRQRQWPVVGILWLTGSVAAGFSTLALLFLFHVLSFTGMILGALSLGCAWLGVVFGGRSRDTVVPAVRTKTMATGTSDQVSSGSRERQI